MEVLLNYDKITGALHEDLYTFIIISCWILLRVRNVSERKYREPQNVYSCSMTFFWKSCRLWDNVEKYDTARHGRDDNMAHTLCLLDN